ALDCARKAVEVSQKSHDAGRLATSQRYLALVLEAQGRVGEAEAALQSSLVARQKQSGSDDAAVADALLALAHNQRLQGKTAEALPLLDRAAALREKLFGKASDQLADVLVEQASALGVARFYSESEKLFLQAIAMKQLVARDGPGLAGAYRKLAESLVQQKRY